MKPYRLLFVTCRKPDTPRDIRNSFQMNAWGLWSEFSKLPHVTLTYQDSEASGFDQPPVDFTLFHTYFSAGIFDYIHSIRAITSKRVMNITETALPAPVVDYNFTFLSTDWGAPSEQIRFPYPDELINGGPKAEKWPKSVLLDHLIRNNPAWCPFYACWHERLWEWLKPLSKDRVIGQMRGGWFDPEDTIPSPNWVQTLPLLCYPEYLERTAPYENYVLTHPGTYEHSVIDMVTRGIRVLIPSERGTPFVNPSIVKELKLPTFSTKEEFLSIINSPVDSGDWRKDLCTPAREIVRRIDSYCQREMQK